MSPVKLRRSQVALCVVAVVTLFTASCFPRRQYYLDRGNGQFMTEPAPRAPVVRPAASAAPAAEPHAGIIEGEFVTVASRPLSSFPAQVDSASYSEVRRLLNQNQSPPANTVRIAEMVNSFAYDYPPPPTSEHPVALTPELWPCPWNSKHYLLRIGVQARRLDPSRKAAGATAVAKDVNFEVEFNPQHVESYRLVGYEHGAAKNREDSHDKKRSDFVGGQALTALYELVPPGEGPKLKYRPATKPSPFADNYEWLTIRLRYRDPDGEAAKQMEAPVVEWRPMKGGPSSDFQFSAAVAAFGLLLRDSPHKGDITWEQVRQMAESGASPDPHGDKAEFLQLVKKASSLKKGNSLTAKSE